MPILFLAVGLGAGVLSGVFGIGGGIIIVPLLVFLAKMQPQIATGTSLGALLLPVGALGAWSFYKNGDVNVPASLWIALGIFVGAYFGARIAQTTSPLMLKRAFAVLLLVMAGKMWMR